MAIDYQWQDVRLASVAFSGDQMGNRLPAYSLVGKWSG